MSSGSRSVAGCAIAIGLMNATPAPLAGELRVGTASIVINPRPGTPLAGYYHLRPSEGVVDDLHAKAAVIEVEGTKVALVVCDLLSLPRQTVVEARKLVHEATAIPGGHVMISATHSHTGPVVARETTRDNLDGGSTPLGRDFTAGLPKLIAQAVTEANRGLVPARASAARGREEHMSFNRRFWMRDGTVGWNPGKLNPNIVRPAGPIDPEVSVVYFEATNARPLLTYVNFAMHPDTTGGLRLSADYPGALARRLADFKGSNMLTLFANGACGNINHLNVNWPAPQQGPEEAERLGTILAGSVFKTYMNLKPVEAASLRVRTEDVELPLPKVTPGDIVEANAVVKRMAAKETKFMELVNAFKVLDVTARDGKPHEVEVQVVAFGRDLAWVSLPGEIFVELGLAIKAGSPFRQTHIAELANGAIGYIPNRSAYAEGNYEVVSARCAEGSGERLVTTAPQASATASSRDAVKILKNLNL